MVVGASKSLILNCSYVSPTIVDVTWLLNGSALDSNRLDRLGMKISRFGVSQEDDYEDGYGDGGDDDDDDDVLAIRVNEGEDDDDGVGDDDVIGKSGKISSERRLGYYSNFGSHHNNNSNYEMYQDDDDDDDGPDLDDHDVDGVGVNNRNEDDNDDDDDDGVLDVTNFRARDFPKQRLRHHHQRKINKRHRPSPDWSETDAILSDRTPDAKVVRKRETGSDESAILYQRPKSSIHKSLEILRISGFSPLLHQGTYQCLLETRELGAMLSREARIVAASQLIEMIY